MAANDDVKGLFKEMHVAQWKVANFLGIGESTFCRMLRKEVDTETKLRIYDAVETLSRKES